MEHSDATIAVYESDLRRWVHDVQGPVTNVHAFSEELVLALKDIEALIHPILSNCSPQDKAAINRLLTDDVEPCLKLLAQSVHQMQSRVDGVSAEVRQLLIDRERPR